MIKPKQSPVCGRKPRLSLRSGDARQGVINRKHFHRAWWEAGAAAGWIQVCKIKRRWVSAQGHLGHGREAVGVQGPCGASRSHFYVEEAVRSG